MTSNTTTIASSFAHCKGLFAQAVKQHPIGWERDRLPDDVAHNISLHVAIHGDAHKHAVGQFEAEHDLLVGDFLQLQKDDLAEHRSLRRFTTCNYFLAGCHLAHT